MGYVTVPTKVIPASREALDCFSRKELESYAKVIGVAKGSTKAELIANLLASKKATFCASLGD